jgi:hypothetical protein
LGLGGLVPLAQPARKTGAQLPAIVALRSDGADLVAARSPRRRPDVDGSGHPLPKRRDLKVQRTVPAAAAPEIADAVEPIGKPTTEIGKASPAMQIDSAVALYRPAEAAINTMAQIGKPTPAEIENGNDKSVFTLLTIAPRVGKI